MDYGKGRNGPVANRSAPHFCSALTALPSSEQQYPASSSKISASRHPCYRKQECTFIVRQEKPARMPGM
ncbi:hypothetical protein CUC01_10270 [Akkermansia muciniphila]|nr:hypothetical protein CUB96_07205 [Akkermansia muciniphila]AYR33430.1 hypothetical protein CUC01_10270 [Akkermansia muciniphila]MCO6192164.1 hypothetical protein [Akkermansia muciniphila]MCO6194062.1 hypothetical protein [Akkermansia muciniphila]MCO6196038.1 hypothetical protein [Akkermansia muciniphila]